jgi:hypothetical protein
MSNTLLQPFAAWDTIINTRRLSEGAHTVSRESLLACLVIVISSGATIREQYKRKNEVVKTYAKKIRFFQFTASSGTLAARCP